MVEVQSKLVKLIEQELQDTTLATVVDKYDAMIKRQITLNLPSHTF